MIYKIEPTDEELEQIFTHNLNNIVKSRNITQEELADKTNLSRKTINRYMTGKAFPNALGLIKISRTLKCSPDDFFE